MGDGASVGSLVSCVVSVSRRRAVSLIFAGWLPQDGAFRQELIRVSKVERRAWSGGQALLIVESRVAPRAATTG